MENDFVSRCLEISTAHITQADAALLGHEEIYWCNEEFDVAFTSIYYYTYGWVLGVPTWPNEGDLAKAVHAMGFSSSFAKVMTKARELNCDYVRLDGDNYIMDSLNKHEW